MAFALQSILPAAVTAQIGEYAKIPDSQRRGATRDCAEWKVDGVDARGARHSDAWLPQDEDTPPTIWKDERRAGRWRVTEVDDGANINRITIHFLGEVAR